jgi:hypothetical protein
MLVLQINPLEALFIIMRGGIEEDKVCMLPFYFYYSLWLVELEKEGGGESC